jgi:hypothetical protein
MQTARMSNMRARVPDTAKPWCDSEARMWRPIPGVLTPPPRFRRLVGGRWQAGFDEGGARGTAGRGRLSFHLTHRKTDTRPASVTAGRSAQATSTGHQNASQPLSNPPDALLSFAAIGWVRTLNKDMVGR